jgi:hypothetical protein
MMNELSVRVTLIDKEMADAHTKVDEKLKVSLKLKSDVCDPSLVKSNIDESRRADVTFKSDESHKW